MVWVAFSQLFQPQYINIFTIFLDRKGLGKDSVDKRTSANKEADYKVDMNDFRQRKKDKFSSNRIWKDIRKCQHACEQLDKDKACDKTLYMYTSNIM